MYLALAACGIGIALLSLGGCANVAPESAQLSAAIGREVNEIERSHLFYVNSYYDQLEAQANSKVDQLYAPAVIGAALNGEAGKELLSRWSASIETGQVAADAIAGTIRLFALVGNKVDDRRKTDVAPIRRARQAALARTEMAYSQVLRSNATNTAYLESLVKLHETREQLFAEGGVREFHDNVARSLADVSESGPKVRQLADTDPSSGVKTLLEKAAVKKITKENND